MVEWKRERERGGGALMVIQFSLDQSARCGNAAHLQFLSRARVVTRWAEPPRERGVTGGRKKKTPPEHNDP